MRYIAAPFGRLLARAAAYRFAVAAADQLVVSLFNFGLTFSLIRLLSATEFGTYGLWIAVASLAISVQSALVCTPLSVHAQAASDPDERHRLEEALGTVNLLFVVLAVAAIAVVDGVSGAEWAPADFPTAVAIPASIAVGLYREYYRSIAFGRHDMMLLILVDGPYVGVTTACIAAMMLWPQHLAGLAAVFLGLTLGGAAAQLCGGLRLARLRLRVLRKGWTAGYRGILGEVMWQVAGVVSTHVQARSYAYITTGLVGLAQLASINAVALLFRPGQTILIAWRRSALPQLAALYVARDRAAFDRRVLTALSVALAGFAAWSASLWLGWHLIDRYFLTGKYPDAALLLLPWTIFVCLDTIGFIISTALQAAREFRFLAYVTLTSAPVTAAATVGFTLWHGYTWTIYGPAVGGALGCMMAVSRLRLVRRRLPARAAAAIPASGAIEGPRPVELS